MINYDRPLFKLYRFTKNIPISKVSSDDIEQRILKLSDEEITIVIREMQRRHSYIYLKNLSLHLGERKCLWHCFNSNRYTTEIIPTTNETIEDFINSVNWVGKHE